MISVYDECSFTHNRRLTIYKKFIYALNPHSCATGQAYKWVTQQGHHFWVKAGTKNSFTFFEWCEFTTKQRFNKSVYVLNKLFNKLQYVQVEAFYRMAGIWSMCSHRWETRHCYITYTSVVYIHFFFNHGLSSDHLYGDGFLAEYKKIYSVCKT